MLIVFAGLPGTGKSSIARELAQQLGAVWLRVDSVEQAIRGSGVAPTSLGDAGYRAAYAMAADNLRVGRTVIGDSVNDCLPARNAWRDTGLEAGVRVIEVETICSDHREHRRRIETRLNEVPGLKPLAWHEVIGRDYQPWDRAHVTIDTAARSVADCVAMIRALL